MNPDFIQKLTKIAEANFSDENFGPDQLVSEMGVSHSTLHRHLKETTGQTISQFIRKFRLEKTRTILLNEDVTISEIAYKVGFGSVTYFNRCFHEQYGCAPGEYKKQEYLNAGIGSDQKKKLKNGTVLIAITLLLVLIIASVIFNKFQANSSGKQNEKSIAVMPFTFSGENPEKEYMCKGMEDNIISSLSKIGDLTVVSVSQSENTNPAKIRKQIHVANLLEGNFYQKGSLLFLVLNLKNTKNEKIKWSDSYDLTDVDIFSTENHVALTIARKLHAEITPEEKIVMGKITTINPGANDFYQKGQNAYNSGNRKKAEDYYRRTLQYDSTFAPAYAGLARIAYDELSVDDMLKENYIDTLLELADKALSFDNTLAEAHTIKGYYYSIKDPDKAIKEYELALFYDPNYWQAYSGLGDFYMLRDNIKAVENYLEAIKRRRGPEYGIMLDQLGFMCILSGLFEQAENYIQTKFEYDEDTVSYFDRLAMIEEYEGNFSKAIDLAFQGYKTDSTSYINNRLAFNFTLKKDYKNALLYSKKYLQYTTSVDSKVINEFHRFGYIYLKNGDTISANKYFQKQIEAGERITIHPRDKRSTMLYDLAATYSILNRKDKAFEYLRMFRDRNSMPWFFYFYMSYDPLLDNIRNEVEFHEILSDVKERAFKERDKLKVWFNQQENI